MIKIAPIIIVFKNQWSFVCIAFQLCDVFVFILVIFYWYKVFFFFYWFNIPYHIIYLIGMSNE